MGDTTTWTPPPPSWLVFSNCDVASAWLASYSAMYVEGDLSWDGVSLTLATNYLRSLVPRNWTTPSDAALLLWYHQRTGGLAHGNVTYQAMIDFPTNQCRREICPYLKWQGDPDLAGVGVSCMLFDGRGIVVCSCLRIVNLLFCLFFSFSSSFFLFWIG